MVNNIVYFGRIIATILLIRLILVSFVLFASFVLLVSFVLFASLPSLQGRAGVRLFSNQPLSRHSRATLVLPLPPSSVPYGLQSSVLRLPSVGLQTPETGLPKDLRVLTDLRDLRDPFAERECKDSVIVNNVYHRNGNFCKKSYFFRLLAS